MFSQEKSGPPFEEARSLTSYDCGSEWIFRRKPPHPPGRAIPKPAVVWFE